MTILITNDDGINSEGLKVLGEALRELGEVFIVAPDRQRSAVGLSITLERPLRVENVGEKTFSVDGMPADCVTLAIHRLMESPPDLIISGINDGQNIGYDIYHSGTVGAAFVGTMFGIPSMAVSITNNRFTGEAQSAFHYDTAAQMALKVARVVLNHKLPDETLLNVNVPNVPLSDIQGIEVTRHCGSTYSIEIHHRLDPRGKKYYWVGGEFEGTSDHPETDLSALQSHKVSVTPLRLDLTDYTMMRELSRWITDESVKVVEDGENVEVV
ncbi:5'/3'-nucleotidase SurE [Candidatus Poribacteria bacterium]